VSFYRLSQAQRDWIAKLTPEKKQKALESFSLLGLHRPVYPACVGLEKVLKVKVPLTPLLVTHMKRYRLTDLVWHAFLKAGMPVC
jgi:hypothetical protein